MMGTVIHLKPAPKRTRASSAAWPPSIAVSYVPTWLGLVLRLSWARKPPRVVCEQPFGVTPSWSFSHSLCVSSACFHVRGASSRSIWQAGLGEVKECHLLRCLLH
jgi:hypothetical protein